MLHYNDVKDVLEFTAKVTRHMRDNPNSSLSLSDDEMRILKRWAPKVYKELLARKKRLTPCRRIASTNRIR
jgi:hypothetical protein